MSRWIRAGAAALVVCFMLSVCGVYGQCRGIRQSVVRLHLLANSDSAEDQQLKLAVRDAIVAETAGWLDEADDAEAALVLAQEQLPHIQKTAQQTVQKAGYNYPVKVELCRMYFTTRTYDTVTLPAGTYNAVRVTIGAGEGHNWWCVVFPPLCLGSAAAKQRLDSTLNASQTAFVTGKNRYQIKFRIVEWAERVFRWTKK